MKYLLTICLAGLLSSFDLVGQERQFPSTIDTNTVNPSEIPSPEKLKKLGATDEEVKKITEFKERKLAEEKSRLSKEQPKINKIQQDTDLVKATGLPISYPKIIPDTERVFGHSFFINNNIKFYDKANQLKAPDNYVLGIGDELSIAIWGYSDFNEVFKIDENGAINPKLVGRIYLKGLSFKDAKGLVAGKFKSVYDLNNSQIDVTLSYSKIITVNIVGEVNNPGSYTIPSINTAFNTLVTVGGIRSIGSVRKIYLKRGGQTVATLDVYEYLMNPNSKQDFFLENNDYLFVPSSGRIVKISGQVKRPLGYELIEKENLTSLIQYAGGFEAGAYRKRIQIKRFLNSQETLLDVDYDSLIMAKKEFELLDGDEVLVRKIPVGYSNYVELIGPVQLPGNYELQTGDRISDIIRKAEGVSFDVFDTRAYIIRLNPDLSKKYIPFNLKEVVETPNSASNIKLQNLDVIKIFSKSYFKEEFIFSVTGAVRSPGSYMFGEGITLKDALYLAGGLKKEAAKNRIEISRAIEFSASSGNIVPSRTVVKIIEVAEDFKIDKASENFVIQPYDEILVRTEPNFELQQNVVLQGEVMYPGIYPLLDKNEKITDVIQRAGGLTYYAFPEGATLSRAEFNTGFLFLKLQEVIGDSTSKYNYILRAGDVLIIPKTDQLIQISGLINYPSINEIGQISAPFTRGKSARYYVKNYGVGFAKNADKKKTYVLEPGGYISKTKHFLFFKSYPKVTKGATIVVAAKKAREKDRKPSEPIDWNKAIENFTVKLTGLATLWLIFNTLVK
ncbi:MAG: SLBB domain-containing protein [Bacteroidota bacterium]